MLDNNETEVLPEGAATEAPAQATPEAAPEQAPQQQPAPEVAPFGGQNFDANNYKMDYRGQQVFPRDAAHAKQLMQQGFSYSQSMEEVGKMRKDLEKQQSDMEQTYGKYKDFDQQLQNNPNLYNAFNTSWQAAQNGEQPGQTGQTFNPVYDKKVEALEGKIQSLLDANEDRALQGNMEKLKQQYPQYDWEADNGDGKLDIRVMRHAHGLGLNENNVHLAFLDYHKDQLINGARTQAAGQVADKVQAQNKAGIQQGTPATAPAPEGKKIDHKNLTHGQLSQLAKADLGIN